MRFAFIYVFLNNLIFSQCKTFYTYTLMGGPIASETICSTNNKLSDKGGTIGRTNIKSCQDKL